MAVSLEDLASKTGNIRTKVLAAALNKANGQFLEANKSPSRKVNELDNRGSHFYLAMYWAEALAGQEEDADLRERFKALASVLKDNEAAIIEELNSVQGVAMDMGGYYHPDPERLAKVMRPSTLFNNALSAL